MQLELSAFAKLSKARAKTDKIGARYADGKPHS